MGNEWKSHEMADLKSVGRIAHLSWVAYAYVDLPRLDSRSFCRVTSVILHALPDPWECRTTLHLHVGLACCQCPDGTPRRSQV